MNDLKIFCCRYLLLFLLLFSFGASQSQMITGVWHGKINKQKVEVKIIQKGDSLSGTSYYFDSPSKYRRYSIKGYFDETDNSVVWWDDRLVEDKINGSNLFQKNKPVLSVADFNCPDGGIMKLDGKTYAREDQQKPDGDVHLDKSGVSSFNDEWNFVIDNYLVGANDPEIIDSVAQIAARPVTADDNTIITQEKREIISEPIAKNDEPVKKEMVSVPAIRKENKIETKITPPTIEQKFVSRKKVFTKEIPVSGDSIELRFYDNAEVDGDSISLFLNGKMIFEHIRLTEKAYTIKLSVNDLQPENELTMVAENLGAIPPNTSYMVAVVGDKRYDAQLASTENSSAMIKLKKQTPPNLP
jgi:hypothetical protein